MHNPSFYKSFSSLPTKEEFSSLKVVEGLKPEKKILEQDEVKTQYKEGEKIITVSAKHGVITIFKIDDKGNSKYYILGAPVKNPEGDQPTELKASIGGTPQADYLLSIIDSLEKEVSSETNNILSLINFYISSSYVCHKESNWGDWSVCFLKLAALSKESYTLEQLQNIVSIINKNLNATCLYGIYELDEIIEAAKQTKGQPEGSNKEKTIIKNYINKEEGKIESWVIFDDNAIATLFNNLTSEVTLQKKIEELFSLRIFPVKTATYESIFKIKPI